jgi:hypothetical protein
MPLTLPIGQRPTRHPGCKGPALARSKTAKSLCRPASLTWQRTTKQGTKNKPPNLRKQKEN